MPSILTADQLSTLARMLEYCRPHGTLMDGLFRERFIRTLPNVYEDKHGNLITNVGTSDVLWSCHTDTVHRTSGLQTIHVDRRRQRISLSRASRRTSTCLGADDTVGVFIMREMILAGVPGRYIFHYGEESGCIGSSAIAWHSPDTLTGIRFAVALDRAGTTDVINTQIGETCCSHEFAGSFARALGLPYKPAHGVFTDTAEYMEIVPECTNLSVGYYHQHTSGEYVDYAHVGQLLAALCALDQSALVCARDPYAPKPKRTSLAALPSRGWDYLWNDDETYPAYAGSGITKIDGRTSATVWRESYGWQDWCLKCDAPIIALDHPDYDDLDHCVCHVDDDDSMLGEHEGLTEDDLKFLRHLRGLD